MTGIGPVAVRAPRIRDRVGTGEERIAFSSAILPPYARRSKSLEVLIPILYLKGISTGGFEEADRKSTRLNSSHVEISYAVFCLKKKKKKDYVRNMHKGDARLELEHYAHQISEQT